MKKINKLFLGSLLILFMLIGYNPIRSDAASPMCSDILVVFARGSSQPSLQPNDPNFKENIKGLKEAFKFFGELDARIAPWISKEKINLANFEGKYDPNGYTAASAFNFDSITEGDVPNALQEKLGVEGNDYINSVNSGVTELTGFLSDRSSQCPRQQIVLGGYSQGAHVIGEAINKLSVDVLNHINYVALFGDPKLNVGFDVQDYQGALIDTSAKTIDDILDSTQFGDVFDQPKAPWVRGDVGWKSIGGGLGARTPYIPDLLTGRVGSWCDYQDAICNGDLSKIPTTQAGHTSYPDRWIGQAANEISEHLSSAFPAYTGAIKTAKWEPHYAKDGVTDVVIVIDTTGSMSSIIAQVKTNAMSIVDRIFSANQYKSPRVGLVEFRDQDSEFVAKTTVELTSDKDSVIDAIANLQTGDGGDDPESWYSGIMQGYNQPWRKGARKIMYFIADTEPKDPEPNTGFTAHDVTQRALEIDPVQIYPIWFNGFVATKNQDSFQKAANKLAIETGGRLIKTPDKYLGKLINGNVTKGFDYASGELATDPVSYIDGPETALIGDNLIFSGNQTYDQEKSIKQYSWDFNNDHIVDVINNSPRVIWRYDEAFEGFITMFATASDGGVTSATKNIKIEGLPAEEAPEPIEDPIDENIPPADLPSEETPPADESEVIIPDSGGTIVEDPVKSSRDTKSNSTNSVDRQTESNNENIYFGIAQRPSYDVADVLGVETQQKKQTKTVEEDLDYINQKTLASSLNVQQAQSPSKKPFVVIFVTLLFIVTVGLIIIKRYKKS